MADPEEQTPYAEVLALQRAGVVSEAIVAKLKARGLDPEQIELLLAAVATPVAPPPEPEPALSHVPVALAPPPEQTCSRCGTFLEVKTYQLVRSPSGNQAWTALVAWALGLFVVAALGGFFLVSYHLRGQRLPSPVVVIHALVAVAAFLLLLAGIMAV